MPVALRVHMPGLQRAMKAGRRSIIAFRMLRAAVVVGVARLQQRPPECGLEVFDHVAFHVRHGSLRGNDCHAAYAA
jgi:hypothetical protein